MGDHAYAYRGPSGYSADGRQRTVIGSSPYYDAESYVVETEVTELVRSPAITDHYGYGSPPPKKSDYGSYGSYEKYRRPSSPSPYYDRPPQEVKDFLNGVQIEASRQNPYTPPKNGAGFGRPTVRPSSGYGNGGYGDYRNGNNYGGYSSSDDDEGEEEYNYKPNRNAIRPEPVPIRPSPKTYGGGEGRWSSPPQTHGVGKLGMPTNNINEAVDYLKGGPRTDSGKPYGSNFKTTEPVRPYGFGSNFESTEPVKPYGYGSNTTPVKPYSYGSNTEHVKPYGYGSSTAPVKPYGYGSNTEHVKPYGYGSNFKSTEPVKPYGYGSDIRSTESEGKPYVNEPVNPYGTYGSDLKLNTDVAQPQGVIDCYEAARRYNGKVIRT